MVPPNRNCVAVPVPSWQPRQSCDALWCPLATGGAPTGSYGCVQKPSPPALPAVPPVAAPPVPESCCVPPVPASSPPAPASVASSPPASDPAVPPVLVPPVLVPPAPPAEASAPPVPPSEVPPDPACGPLESLDDEHPGIAPIAIIAAAIHTARFIVVSLSEGLSAAFADVGFPFRGCLPGGFDTRS